MSKSPFVSIIFVYYNTPNELIDSVNSVNQAVGDYSYEIIIVDNHSSAKVPKNALKTPASLLIKNETNVGYGAALNQGAKIAKGKYLLLSNPDIVFQKNAISLMVDKLEKDSITGIIGPQFLNSNKKIQKVGSDIPLLFESVFSFSILNKLFQNNKYSRKYFIADFDRKKEKEIPAIAGACMLIRKDIFNKVKGFDERFFMYFEEADICYKILKAGFKVLYYPSAKVIHLVGRSSDDKKWIEKTFEHSRYEFLKKYHGALLGTLGEGVIRLLNFPAKLL